VIEQVRVVAHGRPAGEALAGVLRAVKAGRPLAPVTVVVPSNFAGLAARRLLGGGSLGGSGVANVAFVTPFRLAELLASDRLGGRRPLTNAVLGSAVRRALAQHPGPFTAAAGHHGTERALAALHAELSHVSPATLATLEQAGGAAAAAVAHHRAVAALLAGFHDEDDVAQAAALRPDLAAALGPYGHLVWYLPEPTTPALGRFLAAAVRAAPATAVVALTGDPEADAPVLAACRRAGVEVPDTARPAPPVASAIVSVTDADEEVRATVRRIAALAEAGVPLHRIGVFHPTPDPYLRTLRQQLAGAGIPANGPSPDRLADSAAGRTLLAALALPAQRWRRDRVLALISGAPVRHGSGPARPVAWEQVSRRAGVVADLADWRRKLATRRHLLTRQLEALAPEATGARLALGRERDDVDELGRFVEALAHGVGVVDDAAGWAAKVEAAHRLLGSLVGPAHRRSTWPEAEQRAAEGVEAALDRLAVLDDLEPRPSAEVFRRALAAELDLRRARVGRFGEGVVYGPLSGAVGSDFDAVFVLGMAEGTCPAPRRDDALLPDRLRALAGDGELSPRSAALHDQHRWFLAALAAAPPQARVLVHPRGDLRGGRHRLPSRWLLDTASALAGRRVHSTDFAALGAPVVDVVASHTAGLVGAAVAASVDERDLAAVAAFVDAGGDATAHPATAPVARALEAQRARRSAAFTAWDGNLAGHVVPSPATGEVLSATRLEQWASCGFRYLLSHVLGLGQRDEPERVVDLSPLDRGSLVHTVLERFFAEVIEAGPPEPDTPWGDDHRRRLAGLVDEICSYYEGLGRTGRPVHWRLQRDQLAALLDDFLTADDDHRRRRRARPLRVELPFGLDGGDPVVVPLPDGRAVRFRGKADRVDLTDDGRHLVLDYKTGKGSQYAELAADCVRGGTTLQLGLYAEAALALLGASAADGWYWLVNDEVRFAQYGYPWDPERRRRLVEAVGAIVAGIEAGTFAAVPGEWDGWRRTHRNCAWCEFDRVCPVDRGEQAEVKAAAPELRVRDALVAAAGEAGDAGEERS
jgi:hypothetical protein